MGFFPFAWRWSVEWLNPLACQPIWGKERHFLLALPVYMTLLRFSFLLARRMAVCKSIVTNVFFSTLLLTLLLLPWYRCHPESFATTLSTKRRRRRLLLWVECAAVRGRVVSLSLPGLVSYAVEFDLINRSVVRSILLLLRPQGIDRLRHHSYSEIVPEVVQRLSAPRGSHHHNHKPARTRPFRPRPRKASQAIAKRSSKTGLDVEHNSSRASKQAA